MIIQSQIKGSKRRKRHIFSFSVSFSSSFSFITNLLVSLFSFACGQCHYADDRFNIWNDKSLIETNKSEMCPCGIPSFCRLIHQQKNHLKLIVCPFLVALKGHQMETLSFFIQNEMVRAFSNYNRWMVSKTNLKVEYQFCVFFPVLNAAWRWFLKIVLVRDEIIGKILGTMAKPQFLLVCNPSNKLINTAIEQKQNWPRYCSQFFQQSSF